MQNVDTISDRGGWQRPGCISIQPHVPFPRSGFNLSNQGARADERDNGAVEGHGTTVIRTASDPISVSDSSAVDPNARHEERGAKANKSTAGNAEPAVALSGSARNARRARGNVMAVIPQFRVRIPAPVHFLKNETWCPPVHPRFSGLRTNTPVNACRSSTSNWHRFETAGSREKTIAANGKDPLIGTTVDTSRFTAGAEAESPRAVTYRASAESMRVPGCQVSPSRNAALIETVARSNFTALIAWRNSRRSERDCNPACSCPIAGSPGASPGAITNPSGGVEASALNTHPNGVILRRGTKSPIRRLPDSRPARWMNPQRRPIPPTSQEGGRSRRLPLKHGVAALPGF